MMITITPNPFFFILLLAFFLLTGCATAPLHSGGSHSCQGLSSRASKDLNDYSLYINSSSTLYDVNKQIVADPNAYVAKIFKNYNRVINVFENNNGLMKQDNHIEMTVFIHGGLNTSQQVSERIKKLKDQMLEDCKYPVFISWRSGFPGNYLDHLLFLRRGEYSSTGESGSFFDGVTSFIKGPLVSPFVLMEDSLRAATRFPSSAYNVLVEQNIIRKNFFDDSLDTGSTPDAVDNAASSNYTNGININLPPKDNDEDLGFGDLWSVANPIKLVTAPYVDSLGSGAWNSMLRRTDLIIANDEAISINQSKPEAVPKTAIENDCKININANQTAVSEFFRFWQCHYQNSITYNKNTRIINIIGHSMGTIISNKIIAKYPEIKFANIVFMAAACSLNDIAEIISPYLIHHPDANFYNLSLHPKRDQFENSSYVDIVPRGSLLWWIDNTLAEINSFQDRTAGYWPNIYKVAPKIFPQKIHRQVHLTKFGMVGNWPQSHGSFDDFEFWKETFWTANR
ncbi:MAG: hypothetical protein IPN42_18990 [Methylococcaceae bacterium]|nr:hypothetical protein [Methylococcaceae bacterium]